MRKAIAGLTMGTIISLVLALIALILLWVFHEKVFTFFKDILPGVMHGMLCSVLKPIAWLIPNFSCP